jgi:two-component system NtrC family sensor kinase
VSSGQLAPSLRRKIAFAYFAVAFLTLALSLFAFEELRVLEDKVLRGQRITELFDTALEIRRFERNLFLHGQSADYGENRRYSGQMLELLQKRGEDFAVLGAEQRRSALLDDLATYRRLMDDYERATGRQEALEPAIRAVGQNIVATAEQVAAAERQRMQSSLIAFRQLLIVAVGVVVVLTIAIGQVLSRRVVQPLKQIQTGVDALVDGTRSALAVAGDDREIVSIVAAFNQMLKELELRQKHLLRSEKLASMGTMVSGVAHELNNPISNIWSSCQLMLEDPAFPAAYREPLREIDGQSVRARNIIRSLLDFARERPFAREDIAVKELVQQSLRFLKGDMPAGLGVTVEVADDLVVRADRQRLQQMLLNLIRNAVEATSTGGHVGIGASRHDADATPPDDPALLPCSDRPYVEIRVSDDGHGIAPELLARVFDPFFTTKEVGRGMGLGLFIVYGIVDEHDGCVSATSQPGQGATFTVRLPVEDRGGGR